MRTRTPDGRTIDDAATPSVNLKRRGFLLAVGAGGAGAAAAAAATLPGVDIAAAATDAATEPSGYRETEHVRDYYRTARI
jgi:hypothetical protein